MENQIVDRTKEKIELANELGLEWGKEMIKELEFKSEVSKLTSMNFKPITRIEIQKRLIKNNDLPIILGTILSVIGIALFIILPFLHQVKGEFNAVWLNPGILIGFIGFLILVTAIESPRVILNRMALKDWKDNIPYGALLAVKEAKSVGLSNFWIYYPVRAERRMMADPIIVGYLSLVDEKDTMFEIFYWDDGKVYE